MGFYEILIEASIRSVRSDIYEKGQVAIIKKRKGHLSTKKALNRETQGVHVKIKRGHLSEVRIGTYYTRIGHLLK